MIQNCAYRTYTPLSRCVYGQNEQRRQRKWNGDPIRNKQFGLVYFLSGLEMRSALFCVLIFDRWLCSLVYSNQNHHKFTCITFCCICLSKKINWLFLLFARESRNKYISLNKTINVAFSVLVQLWYSLLHHHRHNRHHLLLGKIHRWKLSFCYLLLLIFNHKVMNSPIFCVHPINNRFFWLPVQDRR